MDLLVQEKDKHNNTSKYLEVKGLVVIDQLVSISVSDIDAIPASLDQLCWSTGKYSGCSLGVSINNVVKESIEVRSRTNVIGVDGSFLIDTSYEDRGHKLGHSWFLASVPAVVQFINKPAVLILVLDSPNHVDSFNAMSALSGFGINISDSEHVS